jgi:3-oxoacyl-[acyl-carrier-protein] synthase-3
LHSDGSGLAHIHHKAGGSRNPATAETVARREHFISLNGRVVFREAVERMIEVSNEVLGRNGLTIDDIDWFVPHQANLRIVEAASARAGVPSDRIFLTVEKYGNTSAASIPLSLWEHEKRLKRGDKVLLTAFGGGFTWGGALVDWSYDGVDAGKAAAPSVAEEPALLPAK